MTFCQSAIFYDSVLPWRSGLLQVPWKTTEEDQEVDEEKKKEEETEEEDKEVSAAGNVTLFLSISYIKGTSGEEQVSKYHWIKLAFFLLLIIIESFLLSL